MNWGTDTQFETYTIKTAVENTHGGWTLSFDEGSCLWCTGEECKVPPQPGETARLYGKGFGYQVRGIVIGGRVYRYQDEAQAKAEHEAQCAKWQREREEAEKKHREEIAKGRHAPVPFSVKEGARADWEKGLANNTDPYGRRCYTYAAQWAALMEPLIADGITVAQCAEECAKKAETDGITGFMYGVAVSILAHCWVHGEALRRWHNKETQVGDEGERANESGGVLNPAVLSIGAR